MLTLPHSGMLKERGTVNGQDLIYAEPGVDRFAISVVVSGRIPSGFPDRISEQGPNTTSGRASAFEAE